MTISDIVDAVSASYTVWRTLRGIEPVYHDGRIAYVTGNAAVTFTVRHDGRTKMLKCYTRSNPYRSEIYGEKYLPRELCVIALSGVAQWVDCLLYERIEGESLDDALCHTSEPQHFSRLATSFDAMVCQLLHSGRTHGDLKPENIIVASDDQMHPIDFDAAFIPAFAGKQSVEVGTAAYQHPARTTALFDEHIDDYSIAFISTLLHAAALKPELLKHFRSTHEPPFMPHDIVAGRCAAIDDIIEQFARRGDAIRYRIARMLISQWPRLFNLKQTILYTDETTLATATDNATLEQEGGLWGCRNQQGWIIPPLYDGGFDPTEGYMVATLGSYTHLIDIGQRRVVYNFEKGITAKPVCNNEVKIRRKDGSRESLPLESLLQNSTE